MSAPDPAVCPSIEGARVAPCRTCTNAICYWVGYLGGFIERAPRVCVRRDGEVRHPSGSGRVGECKGSEI